MDEAFTLAENRQLGPVANRRNRMAGAPQGRKTLLKVHHKTIDALPYVLPGKEHVMRNVADLAGALMYGPWF